MRHGAHLIGSHSGIALAVLCSLFCARAAFADATPAQLKAARELFAEASRDEDAGRWSAALEKLHRIAEVKQTAGVRYHVALCEERLGQTATALAHYTEALRAAHDEKNKEVTELLQERVLRDLRARVPTLTLEVPAGVEAAVQIDGHAVSANQRSAPMSLDPGEHRVEARAPNRSAFATTVTLADRDAARVTVLLPLLPPPPVAAQPKAPIAAPAHASRAAAIVTTAGAVVLAGAGIGAYLVAGAKEDDARRACAAAVHCEDRAAGIRAFDAIALGAWIGAAALGGIAIVLWARPGLAPRDAGALRPEERAALRVVTGVGSLRIEGAF